AAESLAAAGLAARCQVIAGSFFDTVPSGADAYLVRHIIHYRTHEQSGQTLGRCRAAMPGDGRLLLVECVVPAGNAPSLSKDFDLTTLTFHRGIERTAGACSALPA